MRDMEPDQLVELASLLVTLMIFFSIDAKHRFNRKPHGERNLFHTISMVGGIATAVAFAVVWVELFLPEENKSIDVLLYFLPSSIAVLAALILAFELLVLHKGKKKPPNQRENAPAQSED
ncbi:hypothetical protein [Leucobacter sp. M11]|uniref:hypothetical protein n=1 Tax=Leucobacter sp. M11 TaxID=2993565 RepID=UPI002D7FBEA6|nr:hypothetical protein [Leucobacter sp. M11]MEB4614012.1 hypothetical protein [Leucobacter sp. M11]